MNNLMTGAIADLDKGHPRVDDRLISCLHVTLERK